MAITMMNSHSPAPHLPCDRSGSSSTGGVTTPNVYPRSYLEPVRAGEVLGGRYELSRLAGSGGMADVFESIDRSTGGRVAVKVMSELRPTAAARFEREARLLASFRHADIVSHVAHGTMPTGQRYLVMEWLEGEDLAHLVARRRLTVTETLVMGARLGRALGVMHARGVVHRDVKPGNVFLVDGRVENPKVLDLGLARIGEATDLTQLTQAGTLVGTLGYIAPEQAQSESAVDARADVFSLGCVLFKCLTGSSPFAAERLLELLAKLLHGEAPRLRDRCPEAPAALEALIARMLAKNPDDRPRDGREVAEALEALARGTRSPRRLLSRAHLEVGGAGDERVGLPRASLDAASGGCWHGEVERGAVAGAAVHPDAPAVCLDDGLGDVEAEAHALTPPGELPEHLEHVRHVLGWNAGAGVPNREAHLALLGRHGELHATPPRRELDGVDEQIRQHLKRSIALRAHRAGGAVDPGLETHACGVGPRRDERRGRVHELGHRHLSRLDDQALALEARSIQKVGDEPLHVARRDLHPPHHLVDLFVPRYDLAQHRGA